MKHFPKETILACISIPYSSKIWFLTVHFYERPTLIPVFHWLTEIWRRYFLLQKKKKKEAKCKNQIQHFFGPIMETAAPKAAKVASPSSFPENHTQHLSISHQAATALNCVKDKVASLLNLNVFCVFIS